MLLLVVLLSFCSAYRAIINSEWTNDQPDERWFQGGDRKVHREPEFNREERSYYQPRLGYNSRQRFSRFSNKMVLSEKECLQVIKDRLSRGDFENPLDECAEIHSFIMKYLFKADL